MTLPTARRTGSSRDHDPGIPLAITPQLPRGAICDLLDGGDSTGHGHESLPDAKDVLNYLSQSL